MKFPRFFLFAATGLLGFLASLVAKETHKPAATPPPAPLPSATPANAFALPLGQVIHAATGKNVLPFDAANPADAAFLVKLGAVMDRVLPRMNKAAARPVDTDEIAARFEEEILAAVHDVPSLSSGEPSGPASRGFPAVRLTDAASGKTYYLAVTLYPAGKRGETGRSLVFFPGDGGPQITADGGCLLVGIEHNGKTGAEMAFLNWDVTDVATLPVHVAVTFEGDAGDVYHPGAVLTDGRKGSD